MLQKFQNLSYWPRLWVVLVVTALATFLAFDNLCLHAGDIVAGYGGDAGKNYFTPIWYVLHDSGGHFTGMHYPYGDNLAFADAQPLLSMALQWYHVHISPLSASQVLAAINGCMVLGIWLCCVIVYLLLMQARLPWWFALLSAVAITFLSPQVQRIYAHYALSYAFAIPLVWLLVHKLFGSRGYGWWALGLMLAIGCLSLLHLYYLPVCGIFVLLYAGNYVLFNRQAWRQTLPRAFMVFAAVVLPYMAIQAWLVATTGVFDRVVIPYGMEVYLSKLNNVFFPSYMPLLSGGRGSGEGYGYVGLVGVGFLLLGLYRWFGYARSGRWLKIVLPVAPNHLRYAFWPAIAMLVFGLGFPFLLLKDWLPDALQQFRSLGRFVWVFYYVATISAATMLYSVYRRMNAARVGGLASFMLILALSIWYYEGQVYLRPLQKHLSESKKKDLKQDLLSVPEEAKQALEGVGPQSYQAIINIPFFHGGSDKIGNNPPDDMLLLGMQYALHLKLPLVSSNMARTSIGQTADILQLFASPLIKRQVAPKFNGKDLLLLVNRKWPKTMPAEMLISKATLIAKMDWLEFYRLPVTALQPDTDVSFTAIANAKDTMIAHDKHMWVSEHGYYYADGFDDEPNTLGIGGSGAKVAIEDTVWLFDALPIPPTADSLEVSFWVKITAEKYGMGELKGQLKGTGVDHNIWANLSYGLDVCNGWLRFSYALPPTNGHAQLQLYALEQYLVIDHLMVKPLGAHVYQETATADTVIWDNYFLYGQK